MTIDTTVKLDFKGRARAYELCGYEIDELAHWCAYVEAINADLLEAVRRVDHTLLVHGKVDAETPLHEFVRDAIAKAGGSEQKEPPTSTPEHERTVMKRAKARTLGEAREREKREKP
jgi:hypothetical protein